jgi:hypothetical protein
MRLDQAVRQPRISLRRSGVLSKQRQSENRRFQITSDDAIAYARMSRRPQSQASANSLLSATNRYGILATDKAPPAFGPTRMKRHSLKAMRHGRRLLGGAHIPVMSGLFIAAAAT